MVLDLILANSKAKDKGSIKVCFGWSCDDQSFHFFRCAKLEGQFAELYRRGRAQSGSKEVRVCVSDPEGKFKADLTLVPKRQGSDFKW